VQPDVFVVPLIDGRRASSFSDAGRLLLAVEVLSPSSARADRVAKRTLYRDEGVPEYWLIDLDSMTIERSTPRDTRADLLTETLEWHPPGATEPLRIDLSAYFSNVLSG
jgi:Uma2 family endonuclease